MEHGDVVEPEDGQLLQLEVVETLTISSAAVSISKTFKSDEEELVRESLMIAGELCIYTMEYTLIKI